jgi:hypothetical protein
MSPPLQDPMTTIALLQVLCLFKYRAINSLVAEYIKKLESEAIHTELDDQSGSHDHFVEKCGTVLIFTEIYFIQMVQKWHISPKS